MWEWEVYIETLRLVPLEVRDRPHGCCHAGPDVIMPGGPGVKLRREVCFLPVKPRVALALRVIGRFGGAVRRLSGLG